MTRIQNVVPALDDLQLEVGGRKFPAAVANALQGLGVGPLENGLHRGDHLLEAGLQVAVGLDKPSDGESREEVTGADEVDLQAGELDLDLGRVGRIIANGAGQAKERTCNGPKIYYQEW